MIWKCAPTFFHVIGFILRVAQNFPKLQESSNNTVNNRMANFKTFQFEVWYILTMNTNMIYPLPNTTTFTYRHDMVYGWPIRHNKFQHI